MADQYAGPFITQVSATILSDLAHAGYDATAVTKLKAAMDALVTLITQPVVAKQGQSAYPPMFDKAPPAYVAQLTVEIQAIRDAITAH